MSGFVFTKAVKSQEKLRMALDGPAGSGKTWTALILASDIAKREGGRVAVIDGELKKDASLPGSFELKAAGGWSDELSDPVGGTAELEREILTL